MKTKKTKQKKHLKMNTTAQQKIFIEIIGGKVRKRKTVKDRKRTEGRKSRSADRGEIGHHVAEQKRAER